MKRELYQQPSTLPFRPLTEFDYHHQLAATPGISLVLFSSPECGTCRQVEVRLPRAIGNAVHTLFKVDIQQSTALARQFDIFHLPTLFLYRDGVFHAVVESMVSPQLPALLQQLLEQPAQEEP